MTGIRARPAVTPPQLPFVDRASAGEILADAVADTVADFVAEAGAALTPLVLALPRGGVPVAREVAARLAAELDVMLVRKLGTPLQPETAAGAIAAGGAAPDASTADTAGAGNATAPPVRVVNHDVMRRERISDAALDRIASAEHSELVRHAELYRAGRAAPCMAERCIVLVDDGVATGATMRAAIAAVRQSRPECVVVAVPVGRRQAVQRLRGAADRVVCLASPEPFGSIGRWYRDFFQVSDAEVCRLLSR